MPVPFASNVGLLLAAAASAAAPSAPSLRFDQAFPTGAAPRAFHARIVYRGGDGVHRAELWRDGATRLRRDTDGRLITVATRRAGDAAFRMDVIDTRRRIRTLVDRDSLYRVGRFTDWDDLAFGLRRPAGAYRLRALASAPTALAPVAPCRWIALDQAGRTSFVCWSRAYAYPLLMLDGARRPIWRVTAVDMRRPAPALFHPDTAHYIVNNAAADIAGD